MLKTENPHRNHRNPIEPIETIEIIEIPIETIEIPIETTEISATPSRFSGLSGGPRQSSTSTSSGRWPPLHPATDPTTSLVIFFDGKMLGFLKWKITGKTFFWGKFYGKNLEMIYPQLLGGRGGLL